METPRRLKLVRSSTTLEINTLAAVEKAMARSTTLPGTALAGFLKDHPTKEAEFRAIMVGREPLFAPDGRFSSKTYLGGKKYHGDGEDAEAPPHVTAELPAFKLDGTAAERTKSGWSERLVQLLGLLCALVAAVSSGACVTTTAMSGPDGSPHLMIEGPNPTAAYKEAGARCPAGYTVVDRATNFSAAPMPNGGTVAGERHHLLVKCTGNTSGAAPVTASAPSGTPAPTRKNCPDVATLKKLGAQATELFPACHVD
jgi:hypothetical protein